MVPNAAIRAQHPVFVASSAILDENDTSPTAAPASAANVHENDFVSAHASFIVHSHKLPYGVHFISRTVVDSSNTDGEHSSVTTGSDVDMTIHSVFEVPHAEEAVDDALGLSAINVCTKDAEAATQILACQHAPNDILPFRDKTFHTCASRFTTTTKGGVSNSIIWATWSSLIEVRKGYNLNSRVTHSIVACVDTRGMKTYSGTIALASGVDNQLDTLISASQLASCSHAI